jgi:hypothetical protein
MVEVKHVHQLRCCDPFVLAHKVEQVYHIPYPCEKISVWWVVYRVNSHRELAHTWDKYRFASDGDYDIAQGAVSHDIWVSIFSMHYFFFITLVY